MARRNETSFELTEARTVLNRAKTARDDIVWSTYSGNIVQDEASWIEHRTVYHYWTGDMPDSYPHPASGIHKQDVDCQKIYDALTIAINALEPFTGKKKWKSR